MQTPALAQLMGAYLNQDVFDLHPGIWDAVDEFAADDPGSSLIPGEVAMLLDSVESESELKVALTQLGMGFRLLPGQGTYRDWLLELSRRVASLGTQAAG